MRIMMMMMMVVAWHELQLALRFCEKGGECPGDMLSHSPHDDYDGTERTTQKLPKIQITM